MEACLASLTCIFEIEQIQIYLFYLKLFQLDTLTIDIKWPKIFKHLFRSRHKKVDLSNNTQIHIYITLLTKQCLKTIIMILEALFQGRHHQNHGFRKWFWILYGSKLKPFHAGQCNSTTLICKFVWTFRFLC